MGVHGRYRRERRAVAALVTVLLTVVSASIAYAFAMQATTQSAAVATRLMVADAATEALGALNTVEAALLSDPTGFYRRVLPGERSRLCVSGPFTGLTFAAGSDFPTDCGPIWGYVSSTTGSSAAVELLPPTRSDPVLRVRALGRSGTVDSGWEARYVLEGAGRWTWATIGPLDVESVPVTLSGAVYATEEVTLAAAALAAGATVASEATVGGELDGTWTIYDGDVTTSDRPDVRERQASTLVTGSLRTSVATMISAACDGSQAQRWDGVTIPGLDPSETVSTALCIGPGVTLPGELGAVTVPMTARSFLITLDSDGNVVVYSRSDEVDVSVSSPWVCAPLPSCTEAALTGGTHPGGLAFWGSPLGVFAPPLSGVVAVDGQTFVGVCSGTRGEYGRGEICESANGVEPGMTVEQPLTVVAGSLGDPADLVVNATTFVSPTGALGLAATGQVVIPHWIAAPSGTAIVAADMMGVASPAVRFLPESVADAARAQRFAVFGSMMGSNLPVVNPWAVEWQVAPSQSVYSPPWWSGDRPVWTRVAAEPLSGVDVCGARRCEEWLVTESEDPASTVQPVPGTPTAPRNVAFTPGFAAESTVTVTFDPPVDAGASAVSGYSVGCQSVNGGDEVTQTGPTSPVTVTGLSPRRVYVCAVQAVNDEGASLGATTDRFVAWGPPDAPFDVAPVAVLTEATATVDVLWRSPLSNGGLSVTGFDAECSSGETVVSVSGSTAPLRVSGLVGGDLYSCVVRAVNAAGVSEWSAPSPVFAAVTPP